jgi:hypothetical protein
MSAQPVPKPEARHRDPELLAVLKAEWRSFGCAICGRPTDPEPPGGFDVELHHLSNKPRDDYAWNIVGLCGGLTENRCHQLVTENVYQIQRNEQGFLVWKDRRAGGQLWQALRFIPSYSQIPPGASASLNGDAPHPREPERETEAEPPTAAHAHASADPQARGASLVLEQASDAPPSPDDSPELRASQIRYRVNASKRLTMEAAILLNHAALREDHVALGVSWSSYYAALGLERKMVQRMLAAARTLGDQWAALTPAVREQVGLEAVYQGSLLVTKENWHPAEAMSAAVANPIAHLISLRTGDEPSERCMCECPKCGREVWHDRG